MKRIVEETLANKTVQYRVETNKFLGFIPCKWHTDTFFDGEMDMTFDAVFSTIDEAYSHIGIVRKGSPCEVVSRKNNILRVMEQYIPKSALVAEIEKWISGWTERLTTTPSDSSFFEGGIELGKYILSFLNTIEVKEMDFENYNKVKKALSLSFMHFLDANRQEGKMCLSNGECFDIDKAFDEMDFAKLFRYMEKYLKAQKGEKVC